MSVTLEDLDQFHQFARQRLARQEADSLQELVELWGARCPGESELQASLRALEQGIADIDAGRVRPADEVFSDLTGSYRQKPD